MNSVKYQGDGRLSKALDRLTAVLGSPSGRSGRSGGGPYEDVELVEAFAVVVKGMSAGAPEPRAPARALPREERVRQLAEGAGLCQRLVRLETQWWQADHGPLLCFSSDGPLAVVPVASGGYRTYDPQVGRGRKLDETTARGLDSDAFAFSRRAREDVLGWRDTVRHCVARADKGDFWFAIAMGLGATTLGVVGPYLSAVVFETVAVEHELGQLGFAAMALLAIAVSMACFRFVRSIAVARMQGRMSYATQVALVDRLVTLPVSFFRGYSAGDLADRVARSSELVSLLPALVVDTCFFLAHTMVSCCFFIMYGWKIAAVAAAYLASAVIIITVGNAFVLRHRREFATGSGRLNGMTCELVGGISKVRAAGAEARAFARWAEVYADTRRASLAGSVCAAGMSTMLAIAGSVALIVLYGLIAGRADAGGAILSAGSFVGVSGVFATYHAVLSDLATVLAAAIEVSPVIGRIKPLIVCRPEKAGQSAWQSASPSCILVKAAGFRYDETAPMVLSDIDLLVEPGEFVAIVGASGSGKSTLLKMVLGLIPPSSGGVYIDGASLATTDIRRIRQRIGVVLQDSELTPGSILENIVYASECSIEQAWEAARMAAVAEDIRRMPMQLSTMVSEHARNISGGQKQRLLLARALAKRPNTLILDEATSALDNRTQADVMNSLRSLKLTRLVVAHRLSTIQHADRIYVLEKGRIVQVGTFEMLLTQRGPFRRLAETQVALGRAWVNSSYLRDLGGGLEKASAEHSVRESLA